MGRGQKKEKNLLNEKICSTLGSIMGHLSYSIQEEETPQITSEIYYNKCYMSCLKNHLVDVMGQNIFNKINAPF